MKKNFCVMPWIQVHTRPQGTASPCCNFIPDYQVDIGDHQSLKSIANTSFFKGIRVKMLNDEPVDGCRKCNILGEVSYRDKMNARFADLVDGFVENTTSDGEYKDFKMIDMNIRFDNLCNLACRTCGPINSSKIAIMDKVEVEQHKFKPELFNDILNNLPNVQSLNLAGGESMLIDENWQILDRLIQINHTENIRITMTTNATKLVYKDKNVIDYAKKFSNFKYVASIDALYERAEVYRHGSNWKDIFNNLSLVRDNGIPLQIQCTIGAVNALHAVDVERFMLEQNIISNTTQFNVNILVHSFWLSSKILPAKYKETVSIKVRDHQAWLASQGQNGDHWNAFVEFMNSEDHAHMIPKFLQETELMDLRRNENLFETFPELKAINDEKTLSH